jgi:hypothetical protein
MAKAKTVVGLDVHATKIVAAVLDVETGELSRFQMSGEAVDRRPRQRDGGQPRAVTRGAWLLSCSRAMPEVS